MKKKYPLYKHWYVITFLIIFFLSYYKFFAYIAYRDSQWLVLISFLLTLVLVFFSFEEFSKKNRNTKYSNIVRVLIFLSFLSFFTAFIFRNQSPFDTLKASIPYFSFFFYFYLKKINIPIEIIEKYIWFFCLTYTLIYLYTFLNFPTATFGMSDNETALSFNEQRGIIRLSVPGIDVWSMCLFIALSKFKVKRIWIVLYVLLFLFLILRGTRMVILAILLITIYYLLTKYKYKWIAISLIGVILYFTPNLIKQIPTDTTVGKLIVYSEGQISSNKNNDEDIRIQMSKYYLFEFNENIGSILFGNGVNYIKSPYGKTISRLAKERGFWLVDVGYILIFIEYGLIGVVAFLFLWFKVIKQKVPPQYIYAKLYIIYTAIISIAGSYFIDNSIFLCVALYILDRISKNKTNNIPITESKIVK